MRFAIANGEKREAEKGLRGLCIGCEQPVIPKCGPIKVKHWAHKSQCECDHWWENETEWHRSWKNNFPVESQEIRHRADDGEWHIADVKTAAGHILEFQHSIINAEERTARNNFYGSNLIWIVDGLKRKNDLQRFDTFLKTAKLIAQSIQLIRLSPNIEECPIVKDWSECSGPVFFDFGVQLPLWCLLPKSPKGSRYVGPFPRQTFINLHNGALTKNGQTFSDLMKVLTDIVFAYENSLLLNEYRPSLPVVQRRLAVPLGLNRRYMYYPNRTPRRRRRF